VPVFTVALYHSYFTSLPPSLRPFFLPSLEISPLAAPPRLQLLLLLLPLLMLVLLLVLQPVLLLSPSSAEIEEEGG